MRKYLQRLSERGFTLMELLVVIAIIGILTTIVLGPITRARMKGRDAAAKADLAGIRAVASLYYDANNQSYGSAGMDCANPGSLFDPSVTDNVNRHVTSAETVVQGTAVCANSQGAYVVAIPLQTEDSWCIDSNGFASSTSLALDGVGSVTARVACQ